jgi:PAS domain S-box-containing protein
LQAAELRLKELGGSLSGVIVTDSDEYVWRPRAFPIFHLGVPPSLRPHLSVLLPSFLELLEAIQSCSDENRRYSLELGRTAEDRQRVGKDFAQSRKTLLDEIAERKKFEERYQELFENATDIIYTQDLTGNFTSFNKAAESATGYTPDEASKINMESVIAPEYLDLARGMMSRKITGGDPTRYELEIVRKDGRRVPLEVSSRLISEGGKPVGIQGTARDISARKCAEEEKLSLERQVQQAQKMESLGVLAGGIAHDFNNILMAVLGHAELALEGIPQTSPARGNLTDIATAAQRATDLCRQMLAYAGKASFALERVGLRDLVEEMADLLKTTISKKAILTLNLEKDLPPIQADPSQIRQIVMNLIINASEAIGDRDGVITVSVGTTRCDEEYLQKTELHDDLPPGPYVHLEVTDTGSGMDAETQLRIFEPFFTTKFTGRGLGLAAVLGIIRAYKGALKVSSDPGKGTTFKVLFPALTDGGGATRSPDSSPLADWRGKGMILLVDDEESLLALGSRMLEHLGFNVLIATDGLQAVDLYRQRGKEIDLVLMDLTMPRMDGAEALGELRRLNPEVPVVLSSGYSRDDVASRFTGKRLSGVLQKPYTLSKLREALAGLMPA